jgi:hypothetical protein
MLECRREKGGSESSQVKDRTKLPCEIYHLDHGTRISKKKPGLSFLYKWLHLRSQLDNRCSYSIDKAYIYGQKEEKDY